MNDTNKLFVELIRVAISTQDVLSIAPSVQDWKALYEMAKKTKSCRDLLCWGSEDFLSLSLPFDRLRTGVWRGSIRDWYA